MALIQFQQVDLHKPDEKGRQLAILSGLDLAVEKGEIFALAGPSGSGKSSVLRLINRLDDCSGGKVLFDGMPLSQWDVVVLRRQVGFMFQEAALFEGTVMENVLYGLCLQGLKKCDHQPTALALLARVGLPADLLERPVDALSGGQKQRVNLARTLALDPAVILMDEPTSALDPAAARMVEELIVSLNTEDGKTLVLVSHNLEQIARIAHHCAVLDRGRLQFSGTPEQLFAAEETIDLLTIGKGGGKQ